MKKCYFLVFIVILLLNVKRPRETVKRDMFTYLKTLKKKLKLMNSIKINLFELRINSKNQ